MDFELACVAARWFAGHDEADWRGPTPRQVPIEGLYGKWLNKHHRLVRTLAGLARLYWTYLDPAHRRAGGRVHDSLTLGDTVPLPYRPDVVLIIENKDTAVLRSALPRLRTVLMDGSTYEAYRRFGVHGPARAALGVHLP